MKKIGMTLALLAGLTAVLFAGGSTETASGDYKDNMVVKGNLTMGTSPDYPPMESLNPATNKLEGFDIEMMEAVAKIMGLKADWNQMDFSTILTAVQAGQIDLGVSAFTYSKEREDAGILFSTPYLKSAQVVFVRQDSDIKSAKDFAGHKFYAGAGTTGEMAIKEYEGTELIPGVDYQMAFTLLQQGQGDGVVCDVAVGMGYEKTMNLRHIDPPLIDEENCVVTKKGKEELLVAVNAAIEQFMKTDEYKQLRVKYGF